MYDLACKHLYYPLLDRTKRAPYREAFGEAMRNERLDRVGLAAVQLDKLRAILAHAERIPFHSQRFESAGVRAADVSSLEDLRRVPLLTKADVFDGGSRLVSEAPDGRVFEGRTSGSTGHAIRFKQDSRQVAWVDASQARGRRWWGVERGDPLVVLWSRPAERSATIEARIWVKNALRNVTHFDAFKDFDEAKALAIARTIERRKPLMLYGYGSSLGRLAQLLHSRGVALSTAARPRVVEYSADHMYPHERALAEQVFGAEVVTAYGASECGGVAQQCRHGRLHVSVDHAVVEIVKVDGSPAAPDENGRILLTTLNNKAMPLIRYEVGDIGRLLSEPCACGLSLPCMHLESGKSADVIDTSARRGVNAHVFDWINIALMKEDVRGIRQFLVGQSAEDTFELAVVRERPFDPRSVELFIAKMRDYLGEQIDVTTVFVDELPLSRTGKRRYFEKRFGASRGGGVEAAG
jgi:phenylacetate-CoA ligase